MKHLRFIFMLLTIAIIYVDIMACVYKFFHKSMLFGHANEKFKQFEYSSNIEFSVQ